MLSECETSPAYPDLSILQEKKKKKKKKTKKKKKKKKIKNSLSYQTLPDLKLQITSPLLSACIFKKNSRAPRCLVEVSRYQAKTICISGTLKFVPRRLFLLCND